MQPITNALTPVVPIRDYIVFDFNVDSTSNNKPIKQLLCVLTSCTFTAMSGMNQMS